MLNFKKEKYVNELIERKLEEEEEEKKKRRHQALLHLCDTCQNACRISYSYDIFTLSSLTPEYRVASTTLCQIKNPPQLPLENKIYKCSHYVPVKGNKSKRRKTK